MAAEHFDYSKINYSKNDDWDEVSLVDLENILQKKGQVKDFRLLMIKKLLKLSKKKYVMLL